MKKMMIMLACGIVLLASCSKKENPLPGQTWNCTSYKVNTFEIYGSLINSLTVSFATNGTFTYVLNGGAGTGTYSLNDDHTSLSFQAADLSGDNMTILTINDSILHFAGNGSSGGNPGHLELRFVR